MTKRNNKGFSLIDVIIAVAVLTLLVSPILYQVVQTLNVSRESKERQYVLDNAQYVVGYFQNTPLDELAKYQDDNVHVEIKADTISTSDSKVNIQSYASGKVKCELYCAVTTYEKKPNGQFVYDANGNKKIHSQTLERIKTVGATPEDAYAEYNASVYKLSDSEVGYKGKFFSREVLINDLSNAIMEMDNLGDEYTISYNVDPKFVPESGGWEIQTDGSCVKYGDYNSSYNFDEVKDDGSIETKTGQRPLNNVIVAIVCEKKSDYVDDTGNDLDVDYINPNSADIGFIQDLDASKVALIQGNAAGFDKQAEADFFTQRMNQLKQVNREHYLQVLTSKTGQTGFNREVAVSKITKIEIHKISPADADQKSYYQVDCNVYYYDDFNVYSYFDISTTGSNRIDFPPISLSYSVYSKKFYSNRSPDIYLVYEPFVTNSSNDTVEFAYASSDYIIVSNDKDCKNSKLYLIKPNWDQLSVKYDSSIKYPDGFPENIVLPDDKIIADTYTDKYPVEDIDKFYTKDSRGTLTPVQIKLMWLSNSDTENKPLKVYTNITTEDPSNATLPINRRYDRKGNFKNYSSDAVITSMTYNENSIDDLPDGSAGTIVDYYGNPTDDEFITEKSSTHPNESDIDYILPIERDSQDSRRLYNVTVSFTELDDSGNKTNNVTRYSGGKENN